jgi:hypothetical protein
MQSAKKSESTADQNYTSDEKQKAYLSSSDGSTNNKRDLKS